MDTTLGHLDEQQFVIAIERLATALVPGGDASPWRGGGVDYAQSRPYQQGDSIKSIDWRVTARTGRAHVKEFEALKQTPVVIVVDGSASMRVSSQRRSKWDWAVYLAGGIALAALRRSSPVGVVRSGTAMGRGGDGHRPGQGLWCVKPTQSRDEVLLGLYRLRHSTAGKPAASEAQGPDRMVGAQRAPDAIRAGVRVSSMVVMLSDLQEDAALTGIRELAQRHEMLACQLVDPAEEHLPIRGIVRGREAESGRPLVLKQGMTLSPSKAIADECRRAGVPTVRLRTDRDVITPMRAFLLSRRVAKVGNL